jgi:cytochrome c biogenesis protein CcdA
METYGEAKLLPNALAFVGDDVLLGAGEVIPYVGELAAAQLGRDREHWQVRRPQVKADIQESAELLAILPVALAGLADGVNPCAFAAMVLLVSVLATMRPSEGRTGSWRGNLLLGGGAFCFGVFTTYYLAGLGLFLGARQLQGFPVAEALVFWAICGLAVIAGVLSVVDAVSSLRADNQGRVLLKVPEVLRRRFAPLMRGRFSRYGLFFGGLAAGFLIAVLEGICTGQMYLPTIQYMSRTPGLRASGAAYLLLYNVLFMLPLIVILGAALAGVHFQRLNAFLRRHIGGAKLLLAAVFFMLAAAMVLGR